MEVETGSRSSGIKDSIIQRHELLCKSVRNQQISLRDKDDLLYRLEQISNDIIANRNVTQHDLQQWDKQLTRIHDDIAIASNNYLRNERNRWIDRIFKEMASIFSIFYSFALKPIIILSLIVGFWAVILAIWKYFLSIWICSNISLAHVILPMCISQDPIPIVNLTNSPIKIPSIPKFVETSTELSERLSNVDVSAPNKLTAIKISLIDLKSRVMYSNIEQFTKQRLTQNIGELRTSVEDTTETIHKMLAAFGRTLSKLEIYTTYTLKSLTDESSILINIPSNETGLVIANFENKIQSQFQRYLGSIEGQVEDVIFLAEDTHRKLLGIEGQCETINDILSENHYETQQQLDKIEQMLLDEGYISKLYRITMGSDNMNQVKHQRNLQTLNEFKGFIKSGIIDVNNIILKLKQFKSEATSLKITVSEIDLGETMSVNVHIDILKNGIEQLKQSKQRLDGKIKSEQIRYLEDDGL